MVLKKVDHPSRRIDANLVKAVDALKKLREVNVSFILAVHLGGKTRSFGTSNALAMSFFRNGIQFFQKTDFYRKMFLNIQGLNKFR